MKKAMLLAVLVLIAAVSANAQNIKTKDVPVPIKEALMKKYPKAAKVSWEKEKGNFEANWGGKSGEDNSAVFTPAGAFVEIVKAIPVTALPQSIAIYVKEHHKGVAPGSKFQRFQGQQHYDQRDPRVAAPECAVVPDGGGDGQRQQPQYPPA